MVRYLLCLHLGGNDQTVVKAVCKVRRCEDEGVRGVSECKIRVWRGQSCIQGFSVGWTLPEHIMYSDDCLYCLALLMRFFVCACWLLTGRFK